MIDELTIQKIKDSSNVVDVIRDFYDLRKDGPNFTCLCPFHEDKHIGSFKVSESRNIYTCYSCGAHGGPIDFLMNHERLSFPDALRWLGKKYGIDVEGSEQFKVKPCKPHKPAPQLPTLYLPKEYVKATLGKMDEDQLCKWLNSLQWSEDQRSRIDQVLKRYLVGHGKNGHTIFWQIDDAGKIRTGKMMMYKPDGHRDKSTQPSWIHSQLERVGLINTNEKEYKTCLFGQHLIDVYPDATINLVESEKTAIICSIAYGNMKQHLWIATGGMQFFTSQKLEPLIKRNRKIILYPDKDGIEQWRERMEAIGYKHIWLNTDILNKYWIEEDGPKADIADIMVRLISPAGKEAILHNMIQDNPNVKELINTFDLEICND